MSIFRKILNWLANGHWSDNVPSDLRQHEPEDDVWPVFGQQERGEHIQPDQRSGIPSSPSSIHFDPGVMCTRDASTLDDPDETKYRFSRAIGDAFEEEVQRHLDIICERFGGQTFRSIVLPTKYSTTEVDIIVCMSSFILIVECKNWSGTVYANYDQYDNWIRVRATGVSDKFYSPVKQNSTHVGVASSYLGIQERHLISAIVFPDSTVLKKLPPHGDSLFIGHLSDFCKFVRKYAVHHAGRMPGMELCKAKLEQLEKRSEYTESCHHENMKS